MTLEPPESRGGTVVTVYGSGFPPSAEIEIRYTTNGEASTVASATGDADGKFSTTFTVPITASIPSTNSVAALSSSPTGPPQAVTVTHRVPRASVAVSPASGAPGQAITVTGNGFLAFASVSSFEIGGASVLPAPTPATDSNGIFNSTIVVPQLDTGTHTMKVSIGHTKASVAFTVTRTVTAQPIGADPVATALAPLGSNLLQALYFDSPTQQWSVYDPSGTFTTSILIGLLPSAVVQEIDTSSVGQLTQLVPGQNYWLNMRGSQQASLGGVIYNLFTGMNPINWQGAGTGVLTPPASTPTPKPTPTSTPTPIPASALKPVITLEPASGPELTRVRVTATGFPASTPFGGITIGGSHPLSPPDLLATLDDGSFTVTSLIPALGVGAHTVQLTAGEYSGTAQFMINSPANLGPAKPAAVLPGPLTALGEFQIWHFDTDVNAWTFYDSRPAFAPFVDFTELVHGEIYWLPDGVAETVTLGSTRYDLVAGWNNILWQG